MQLTSEQRIFVVTNYLRARNFKDVQLFFEQRFLDLFVSNIKIKIELFYNNLLPNGFEYVYLKFYSTFYLLALSTLLMPFT